MEIAQQIVKKYPFLEEITPKFSRVEPRFKLHRYDRGDDRYYFRYLQEGLEPFISVTSYAKKCVPKGEHLNMWYAKHGPLATLMRNKAAHYGEFSHIMFSEIALEGGGNLTVIADQYRKEAERLGYVFEMEEWGSKGVKNVLSWLQFLKDKEVKIIAIEFPIASSKYGLGGLIDYVIEFKYGRRRWYAIVDCKFPASQESVSFYEGHEFQLLTYRELWNDMYGDIFPVSYVFNWAPINWKKDKPTYKFQNQNKSRFSKTIKSYLRNVRKEGHIKPPMAHVSYGGEFTIESFDIKDHIIYEPIKIINNEI